MSAREKSAILLTAFLCALASANAIKCFQCDSFDDGCSTLKTTDVDSKYFRECDRNLPSPPFCRKTIQTIMESNNLVRITRACGWKTSTTNSTRCFKNDTQFKLDVTCQCHDDGCNSGPGVLNSKSKIALALPVLTMLAMKIKFDWCL